MAEDIDNEATGPDDGTEDIEQRADDLQTAVDELRRELDDLKTEKDRLAQKIEDTEQSLIDLKRDGQNRDFIDPELDTDPDIEAGIEDGNDHFRVGIESGVVVVREGVWTHHWSHTDEGSDPYSAADDTVEQKRGSYKYAGGSPTGSGTILYADLTISDTDTREGTVTLVWDSNLPALIGTAEYGAYISDDHCVWPLAKIVGTQVELLWVGGDIVTTFGGGSSAGASGYDGPFAGTIVTAGTISVKEGLIYAGRFGSQAWPTTVFAETTDHFNNPIRNGKYYLGFLIDVNPDSGIFDANYKPELVAFPSSAILEAQQKHRWNDNGLPNSIGDKYTSTDLYLPAAFIIIGDFDASATGAFSNWYQRWQGTDIYVPVHEWMTPTGGDLPWYYEPAENDGNFFFCSFGINVSYVLRAMFRYMQKHLQDEHTP
jgi:hypothetical protein